MYLSRLFINRSRLAWNWVTNPYRIHQRLMMALDGDPRVLFRPESRQDLTCLLAQSCCAPRWDFAFDGFAVLACAPECKPFDPTFTEGQVFAFRLRANPTAKRTDPEDNKKKRVGIYREEEQLAWLTRKGEVGGFKLLRAQVRDDGLLGSFIPAKENEQEHALKLLAVQFDGLLQVTDPTVLRATLQAGIGSAKGFGFGLLSLAPARLAE
ncbi:MAG: type I-E CRISPR-associated protein Cas6/Cse3/CasE [Anaerolineae bacterium]